MKKVFEFVSTNVLSGLENVVINICTLVKGYNFTYVSPSGPIDKYLKKYHIHHIVVSKISPISVRKVIKKYHPNIVHGHDVKASLSVACNSHLCHSNNIGVISELHNDDSRMWKYSLRSILYALSSHCYDKVIVVYKSVINHYIFKNIIRNKVMIINNILNTYRIRHKLNFRHVKKWDCIFLGRLVDQKNPMRFVHIISDLKKRKQNINAVIVGDGNLFNTLKNHINKLGLQHNISMVGFQSNPFKYLGQSKILVMPSKYEGLSLVALEALYLKIPIICSHTSGLTKILGNKCGYLEHSNKNYVNDITKLLNNKKLYRRESINSFKRINHINDIPKFINSYHKLYSEL